MASPKIYPWQRWGLKDCFPKGISHMLQREPRVLPGESSITSCAVQPWHGATPTALYTLACLSIRSETLLSSRYKMDTLEGIAFPQTKQFVVLVLSMGPLLYPWDLGTGGAHTGVEGPKGYLSSEGYMNLHFNCP